MELIKDVSPGFCSSLVLIMIGSCWPITDHSSLNKFVQQIKFKMEIAALVVLYFRKDRFMAMLNLENA